jgi:N-6 DNA methylase/type I restriction and modification enzyme subunit R-like protein
MSASMKISDWLLDGIELSASNKKLGDFKAHASNLFSLVGLKRTDYVEGIGPAGSKFLKSKNTMIQFVVTTSEDPQEFFDQNLAGDFEPDYTYIVTNLSAFYCTKNGSPFDGGHFSVTKRNAASNAEILENLFDIQGTTDLEKVSVAKKDLSRLQKIVDAVDVRSNEETVKKDFVFPLCRIAGWHVDPDDKNDEMTCVEVEKYQPHRGRLDLLLKDNGIPRIVLECKKPSIVLCKNGHITADGKKAMEQTHRYSLGVRFWRGGCLPNILSMVTNGKQVLYFDSSIVDFDDAFKTAKTIEIGSKTIGQVYHLMELNRVRETDLSYICSTRTLKDERKAIESSSTYLLSKHVLSWLVEIRKSDKKIAKEDALAMTLQILFLNVARDHGILGSEEIAKHVGNSNWDKIFELCNKRFNSNVFEKKRPSSLKPEVLDSLYEQSRNLPFSLEAIPVEYVGDIYENLLHNLHSDQKHLSKTSYFTPQWLVREIVAEIKPTKDESVIDPTCGSAAFLCYTFDYVTKDMDFNAAKKYLSTKVFGVDRDPLAVQVSRFALLVDLARKVDGDWKDQEHILPKLTDHIVDHNFFTWDTKHRFDVALGNPPWGSIDKEVRDDEIKKGLKSYLSYSDKTDISIYVVEKAFNFLSPKGRMGFLVQRSTIDGSQHSEFRTWWKKRIDRVWDFGADELFAPRNKALTAVLIGGVKAKTDTTTINRSSKAAHSITDVVGKSFKDCFYVLKGAESACNDIYELYAEKHGSDPNVRTIVTPETIKNGHISNEKKALFLHPETPDNKISKKILTWMKKTKIEKKVRGEKKIVSRSAQWWLKQRAEWDKLAWKRLNGSEHYKFDQNQPRIFVSYYLNDDRADAGIDTKGTMVGLTSTTVLIPKSDTSKDFVLFTLAWLNSKPFVNMQSASAKMGAGGGRALYKEYIEPMVIPSVNEKTFNAIVEIAKRTSSRGLTSDELTELDRLFESGIESHKSSKAA